MRRTFVHASMTSDIAFEADGLQRPINPTMKNPLPPSSLKIFLLYIFAAAIIHAPVVLGGRSLSPALLQPHGLVEGAPYGYEGRTPVNTFNVDLPTPAYYEWPMNRAVGGIYKKGELPLWNPHQAAGTPLAADYSTRAFFPYQILEDISPEWSWDFFLIGRPVIAGFFTFLFLSLAGLSSGGAFLGGLLYAFSGPFTWFINLEQFANVAMSLPVMMSALELLFIKRGLRETGLLAVSFALVLLAGQPEAALYALALGAAYTIFWLAGLYGDERKEALLLLLKTCAAFILALMLAAPLILPFLENVKESFTLHPPGAGVGAQYIANWKKAFSILTPAATEVPADPALLPGALMRHGEGWYRVLATKGAWDYIGGYTGVLAIFLALAGLIYSIGGKNRLRPMLVFFAAFGLSIILKNFGARPFLWLGSLPLFDQAWSPRWAGPAWVFSLSVAGASGWQAIAEGLREKKGIRAPVAALLVMAAFFALFILPDVADLTLNSRSYFSGFTAPYVLPSITLSNALALLLIAFATGIIVYHYKNKNVRGIHAIIPLALLELWWAVPRGWDHEFMLLKLIPLALGLAAVFFLVIEKKAAAIALGAAAIGAFLLIDLKSPNGLPSRHGAFEAPYVDFLKERAGVQRVAGGYGALHPNYASAVGLYDVHYINALLGKRLVPLKESLQPRIKNEEAEATLLWFTGMPQRLVIEDSGTAKYYALKDAKTEGDVLKTLPWYSFLGVKYFVMPAWFDQRLLALPLVYDKEVKVFENPNALPRAFVASSYADEKDGFSVGAGELKAARIKEFRTNSVVVEAPTAGLLVLTDAFFPGWKAYVEGEPVEIKPVEGMFRGVLLKGGAVVEFVYSPISFTAGAGLFFAGAVIAALFILSRKRPGDKPQDRL